MKWVDMEAIWLNPLPLKNLFKFAYFEDHKGWRVADFRERNTTRICSGIGYGYGY